MKVWVVTTGAYDSESIVGVYSSIGLVVANFFVTPGPQTVGWRPTGAGHWWNGINGDKAVTAQAFELDKGR